MGSTIGIIIYISDFSFAMFKTDSFIKTAL